MSLNPQGLCFPRVHDGELDSSEMAPHAQHRIMDMSQDMVDQNNISAISSVNKVNSPKPLLKADLDIRLENGEVNEAYSISSIQEKQVQNKTNTIFGTNHSHTHLDEVLTSQCTRSTALDIVGTDCSSSGLELSSPVVEPGRTVVVDEVHTPNIVIFGEAGVGKSSIINLIADQKLARTSNGTVGCTFQHEQYPIMVNKTSCVLWDTTGLDEGTEGMVPAKLAEYNLKTLMQGLAHSGGIHLIIYCIRGTRLTKALKRNYDLFYTAVCRKNVPVALVVTGLEHQQGDMETWWDENKAALQRYGMSFQAHACVTTLDIHDAVIQMRRLDSQRRLRDLIVEHARRHPWKIEASFLSWVMFHNIFRGVSSMGKRTTQRVIVYDSTTPHQTRTRWIGDRMSWDVVTPLYKDIQAWPVVDEQTKLDAEIERLCIVQVEPKNSRLQRARMAFVGFFAALFMILSRWQDPLGKVLGHPSEDSEPEQA